MRKTKSKSMVCQPTYIRFLVLSFPYSIGLNTCVHDSHLHLCSLVFSNLLLFLSMSESNTLCSSVVFLCVCVFDCRSNFLLTMNETAFGVSFRMLTLKLRLPFVTTNVELTICLFQLKWVCTHFIVVVFRSAKLHLVCFTINKDFVLKVQLLEITYSILPINSVHHNDKKNSYRKRCHT